MDYPHIEVQNGITIYYYLLPNEIPTRVKIEPVYEMIDSGRYADGRIPKPRKELVAVNVMGVYECLKN